MNNVSSYNVHQKESILIKRYLTLLPDGADAYPAYGRLAIGQVNHFWFMLPERMQNTPIRSAWR
ncbi:hypothetical protein MJM04_27845, partial [Salmonella enterica subsp. enterica serovar Cerro]|nr:hypothetical protein [Salmonella enterica subsp. enterica serovar Cerro]